MSKYPPTNLESQRFNLPDKHTSTKLTIQLYSLSPITTSESDSLSHLNGQVIMGLVAIANAYQDSYSLNGVDYSFPCILLEPLQASSARGALN